MAQIRSNRNIARHWRENIGNELRKLVDDMAEATLREQAVNLTRLVLKQMRGFYGVTGNTKNGIAVALFYKGTPKYIATSEEILSHPATRPTLKRGESYDLPYYWEGGRAGENPFVGKVGDTSYYASSRATGFVKDKVTMLSGWSYVVGLSTEYASYLESRSGTSLLGGTRDYLSSLGAQVTELQGV